MTILHYLGALLVLLFIAGLGVYSGSRVRSAGDFTAGGKKAGTGIVAGAVIGTLVGGASTIGTAQLAFNYGFSAWWFTLGGGGACLILACLYAKPLYESGVVTMPQMLSREYGRNAATTATVLTSLGSFLSIVSQVLSSIALITSVSSLPASLAAALTFALMLAYVLFGGLWGAGLVGLAKITLLYLSVGICGIIAVSLQGGISAFVAVLPAEQYFSLIARGLAVDVGAGLSMILGVITTQAYIQSIIAARSLRHAKAGLFVSAFLIPLIGIAGIVVGLYMKLHFPAIDPASALPLFVLTFLPPFIAGMVLGTLLVAVVGTAAGVALGLAAMFCSDIYRAYCNPSANDKTLLLTSRIALACILAAAALVTLGNLGTLILGWSFMSMGLRGAVAFGILTTAIFAPGRIPSSYAIWSMLIGPVCILAGKPLISGNVDPLFFGLMGSLAALCLGGFTKHRR